VVVYLLVGYGYLMYSCHTMHLNMYEVANVLLMDTNQSMWTTQRKTILFILVLYI